MRKTFVGIIQNEFCDIKTLVLAESAEAARARVLANFQDRLGRSYQESDLTILPFSPQN